MNFFRRSGSVIVAIGFVLAMVLSGCSSEPPVPDGWKRIEEGWLSVTVPKDWVEVNGETTEYWTKVWQDGDDDSATIQLGINPTAAVWGFDSERSQFIASVQLGGIPGFVLTKQSEPVAETDLEIGRVDYTYDADGETFEGVYWAASDPRVKVVDDRRVNKTVALLLTAKNLPAETVQQIQDSIQVMDTDATIPADQD